MDEHEREVLIADLTAIRMMVDSALMRLTGLRSLEIEQMTQTASNELYGAQGSNRGLREAILEASAGEAREAGEEGGELETTDPSRCPYGDPLTCPRADTSRINTTTFTKPQRTWQCNECGFELEGIT